MRFAFFGSSRFSCLVLAELSETEHQIACVVTQPDQPAGRRMELKPTQVCLDAGSLGVPVLKPQRLRERSFMRELESYEPDALLVASFGRIIPAPLLDLTPWPLNVHPSLLPKLRGPSPIRTVLLEGQAETGCCIMRMTPRLDDGDVLFCEHVPIEPHWNYEQLETQLGSLGGTLAGEAFDAIESGRAAFTPQNHAEATYCQMHGREDSRIDWNKSADELDSFVRAWDPDVGAWTTAANGRRLKVWSVSVEEPTVELQRDALPAPGRVLAVAARALWITTGRGVLRVREVQAENRSRMPIASYLAGNKLAPGDVFGS